MLLMIDNYDSFTCNIVQYFGELGADVRVLRNDEIDVAGIASLHPQHLVISPGPCTPTEAGVSVAAIQAFAGRIPILGVCLGHQAIGQAFGGHIVHAREVMHGKTSPIHHKSVGVFADLPNPFEATRYHSLVIERQSLPENVDPQVGQQLQLQTREGRAVPAIVVGVSEQQITVDANHPLAGKDLHFELELVEIV